MLGSTFASSDAEVMYKTSRALAFDGTIALDGSDGLPQIHQGVDGRWYGQYDPGLPLVAAPLVWLSDRIALHQHWNRYAFSAYVVRWLPALSVAAAVALLFRLAMVIYQVRRTALLIALAGGLASPLLVYGRMFFSEATLAALLIAAFYAAYREKWLLAGLALALAMLTRAAMMIYLIPLLILMWGRLAGNRSIDAIASLLIFPVLAVIALGYHNWLRSGDPLVFGYGDESFSTPPWIGIAGLLLSPGKSVFLYAPPLLISMWGWRRFYQREKALALALLLAGLIALLFYGRWWAWHGGWSWGPRFLVPLIPLWMLPIGEVINWDVESGGQRQKMINRLVDVVLLAGVLVSFAGLLTDVNKTYARYKKVDMVNYTLDASPLAGAIRDLVAGDTLHLATFHLQDYGWVQHGAILFPLLLMVMLSVRIVGLVKEINRES